MPGQQAAVAPGTSHWQPSRFLSSGQSAVPPGQGAGTGSTPSGPHTCGGGSFAKKASQLGSATGASIGPASRGAPSTVVASVVPSSSSSETGASAAQANTKQLE